MSTNLEEVKFHYEQLCWLIERTDTVEQLILLKEVCAGFQLKERKGFYEECDCGEKLLICDSGMKLCSVGCKDKYVYTKKEDEMTQHEAVEFSNIQDDWNDKKTEDEKKDWWMAHNGRIEFVTATEKEVEEEGADEWGAIRHFVDKRESAVELTEEKDEEEKVEVIEIIVDGKKYYYDEKTRQLYNPETSEEEGFLPDDFREEDEEQKCEKCNKKYKLMYNDILCAGCRCAKKD